MKIDVYKIDEVILKYDLDSRNWFAFDEQKKIEFNLSKGGNLSPVLKILYVEPNFFWNELIRVQNENNLNNNLIDSFPLEELILFCIKNGLLFWLELAVKWLKDKKINNELFTELVEVTNNRKYSQKLRHQLKNIIS